MQVYLNQEWCRQPQYRSFWDHYKAAEEWRRRHLEMVETATQIVYGNRAERHQPDVSSVPCSLLPEGREQHDDSPTSSYSEEVETADEPMDQSTSEEVDEEYLEFRRKTEEHRRQRDEKRLSEQKARNPRPKDEDHWITIDNEDFILADKVGIHGVVERTLDAPDEQTKTKKRRERAKQLYGDSSEMILAMETSLEMRFDEEYRRRGEPPLWPNIPLKL